MTDKKFIKEYKIPYFLSDRYRKLPVIWLSKILADISSQQTVSFNEYGTLKDYFQKNNLLWIIIYYKLDIKRQPRAGEHVRFETYATGYNRLFSYRQFDLYDEEDNLIVKATLTYAWLHPEKRKLARIEPEIIEIYGAEYEDRIRRMPTAQFDGDYPQAVGNFDVSYFDIDSNDHVNFSVYIRWAIQSLETDFLNNYRVANLTVKYNKEVLEGQSVQVQTSIKDDQPNRVHTHSTVQTDQDNAIIDIEWTKMG